MFFLRLIECICFSSSKKNNVKSNIIGTPVWTGKRNFRSNESLFVLAWPDQSCPDVSQPLIELVKNMEKSRVELSDLNKSSGPVVVHCRYET